MSNDAQAIDRLFKLQAKINMMVVDGKRDATSVADTLQEILEKQREYLRHLEMVNLAPTKGEVTIAEAKDVFRGYIDSDFKNWGINIPCEDTEETVTDVYEMYRDGNFETLFGSLLGDPHKLCLTQGQIKEFCCSHRDSLRQEGYSTFFLFEVKGGLFVASVFVDGGRLGADVCRFDYDGVWSAGFRHRLVVKQQTV